MNTNQVESINLHSIIYPKCHGVQYQFAETRQLLLPVIPLQRLTFSHAPDPAGSSIGTFAVPVNIN